MLVENNVIGEGPEGNLVADRVNVDLIEIHTGQFAKSISNNDESIISNIQEMIDFASNHNLLINAGHDLNLNNLHYLVKIGNSTIGYKTGRIIVK